MNRAGFLDSGVVLGYCFTVDHHHNKSESYLTTSGIDFFISPTVEDEFYSTKSKLNKRYSDAILDHADNLKKSDFEGQLDPLDVREIKRDMLSRGNPSYSTLYNYWENVAPQFVPIAEADRQLRNLARDIEQMAYRRKNELDSIVRLWSTDEDYSSVRTNLSDIHEPDLTICMECHDLALNIAGDTEFATVNPKDFVRNGMEKRIMNNTAISKIVSLV